MPPSEYCAKRRRRTGSLVHYFAVVFIVLVYIVISYRNNRKMAVREVDLDDSILIYNRIPKTASITFVTLLKKLQVTNGFQLTSSEEYFSMVANASEQHAFVQEVLHLPRPSAYERHIHLVDFETHGHAPFVHFNVVRDPVERFISLFTFLRAESGEWFEPAKRELPTVFPQDMTWEEFRDKDLETCIMDPEDKECNYEQGTNRDTPIAYFCGQKKGCCAYGTEWAVPRAIYNLERYYPVVGVLEQLPETLQIMEHRIPKYFRGVAQAYKGLYKKYHNTSSRKYNISTEAQSRLKNMLSKEYELYEYIQQRLKKQLSEIKTSV